MNATAAVETGLYFVVLLALARPLGRLTAGIYQGRPPRPLSLLAPLERRLYRWGGVRPEVEMSWRAYAGALLTFNLCGVLALYGLQRFQSWLPLNPQRLPDVAPDLAFNTAISFATNTNWQAYSGETTLSYAVQMLGPTVQNFVSAAAGMAVLVALIRGLTRAGSPTIGNFWVDLVRGTLYLLLPLASVLALALVSQGVVQSFAPAVETTWRRPAGVSPGSGGASQTVPLGPAASQVAIKQLGTNGGGFFGANSAHPLENPTPLSNFLQLLAILLIPAALCHTFGELVNDRRQGRALLATMLLLFAPALLLTTAAESSSDDRLAALGVDDRASALQSGGNLEGKEVRVGAGSSALWSVATTAASNGSVNSMLDSYRPLGLLPPLLLMQLGEVVFGGVGSGLYGLLIFVLLAVFIAGLMVGRTPEYLGKKIEAYEMKMAALVILIPPLVVLGGTALTAACDAGRSAVSNPGPHGFTQILYAWSSAGNNNGSALAGLAANSPFYNLLLGAAMFVARYALIVPVLAIAGSLARKKPAPASAGTLPTHTPLFVGLLAGVVLLVGALTFLPALALGPIAEHLQATSSETAPAPSE